jgi:predicted N-formylglutamate amidohydrolase
LDFKDAPPMPAESLLDPDEPPVFEILNATGTAPFLLMCDHASRVIPRSLDNLGLDAAALGRHVAYDIGVADVVRHMSQRFDAPLLMGGYSRLLIDPNRHLGSPSSIPVVSEDLVIPGNQHVTPEQAAQRADTFFWPYHKAAASALAGFRSRSVVPAVISVHSFTPSFHGVERPWHIGVLWDRDGRIALPLLEVLRSMPGLCVGDNEPYNARQPEGYSMETHAEAAGYPHVLIEIRQDLIESYDGAIEWAVRVEDALSEILASPDLYRVKEK